MIKADKLACRRGKRLILDDVSVEVRPGEVLAVLGPNGAGKSTLLKMLCGDIKPDSGSILLEDRPLSYWPAAELAGIRGVLPQSSDLSFPLRVIEVVLLGRSPHYGINETKEDLEIAASALERVDLANFDERLYTTLSGGERQRVHLARVLAQLWKKSHAHPSYYFLDEPTASLDIGHQQALLRTARSLALKEGAAVFTVLHDLNQAAVYADRILLLKDGRVFAEGKPLDVMKEEIISRAFGIAVRCVPQPDAAVPLIVPLYDSTC